MSNKRQDDLSVLHPAIRDKIAAIQSKLNQEGHPFQVFEAFRSPERQAYLYAQGRTRPGRKVTNAKPWSSYHQYGLAADFVLKLNGSWSWSTSGNHGRSWARLHEVALEQGLEPLSWEMPHIQLAGIDIADLRAGQYPPGGDEAWSGHLADAVIGWQGSPAAPPAPADAVIRPPLPETLFSPAEASQPAAAAGEALTGEEDLTRPAVPPAASGTLSGAQIFAIAHAFVAKWEGGYVDNRHDPGGATNMGITIATLSRWRQRPVTKAEVRDLSVEEARQIFKAFYFDVVHGESLPLPVAMVTYNAAVLHGPSRAARFLQQSLNGQGIAVGVDGVIGPETLGGVARAQVELLTKAFMDRQEQFLRGLSHFAVFGTGWMNRLNDLRRTVAALDTGTVPVGPEPAPQPSPQPSPQPAPQPAPQPQPAPDTGGQGLATLFGRLGELAELLRRRRDRERSRAFPPGTETAADDAAEEALIKIVVELLSEPDAAAKPVGTPPVNGPDTQPLTPVNAALGQTIGELLDGKKTAIGIIGTLATALLYPVAGGAPAGTTLGAIDEALPFAQPVALAMTAWGVLGKIDKWVRGLRKVSA